MLNLSDDTRLLLITLMGLFSAITFMCLYLQEKSARAENTAGRVRNISPVSIPDSVCDCRVHGNCCDVRHRQPANPAPDVH